MRVVAIPLILVALRFQGPALAWSGQAGPKTAPVQYVEAARSYEREKRFLEAIAEYRKAIRLQPTNERTAIALSRLLYNLGRHEEAFDVRRQLLKVRPELVKVRLELAYLLQVQGRLQEAEAETEAILAKLNKAKVPENDPTRVLALHLRGRTLLGQRRHGEAEKQLLEVLRLRPDFAEAHLNLAELYSLREETYAKAVEHFEQVLKLRADLGIAHLQLGRTLLNLGRTGEAIASLQKALEHQPNQAEPYFLLAAAYRKQGDLENTEQALSQFRALNEARQSEQNNRLKAGSLCQEGEEHLARGNLRQANQAFQKALELDPENHDAYFGLAKANLSRGAPREGLRNIEQALSLQPYQAMYHYTRAVCLDETSETGGAIEAVGRALTLNPLLPQYHNLLGNLLVKSGHYQRAVSAYREAVRLDAKDPMYHMNLATALTKMGKLEEGTKERELYQRLLKTK